MQHYIPTIKKKKHYFFYIPLMNFLRLVLKCFKYEQIKLQRENEAKHNLKNNNIFHLDVKFRVVKRMICL